MMLVESDDAFDEFDDHEFFCKMIPESLTGNDNALTHIKSEVKVEVPHAFQFPYKPYNIQVDLMRKLYESLELGKIGIFESPTGTGKSLSIICASLTWLRDFEARKRYQLELLLDKKLYQQQQNETAVRVKQEVTEEFDWVTEFAKNREREEEAKKLKEEHEQRLKREEKLKLLRKNLRPNSSFKRKRNRLDEQFEELFQESREVIEAGESCTGASSEDRTDDNEEDEQLVVEEYLSEEEGEGRGRGREGGEEEEDEEEEDMTEEHITKIYYCSRTHSQLAQFVREVQKSPFRDETRVVSLGSRQNLCVNEAVKRLKSLSLINDRCLELQKNKSEKKTKSAEEPPVEKLKKGSGCPFYKHDSVLDLRDRVLVEVRDIEQLVLMGKQIKACPYYGTRLAIPTAQLVVLPYNTLLHRSTRESTGIKLAGNIVIIDEGHNLLETISNIHSIEITGQQLSVAHSQLIQYEARYRSRLKAKNLMYIKQLLFILSNLIKMLACKSTFTAGPGGARRTNTTGEKKLRTINDFLFDTRLDNLNLFKVHRYCQRSMIAKKLHGFAEKYQGQVFTSAEKEQREIANQSSAPWALSNFLQEINGRTKESIPGSKKTNAQQLQQSHTAAGSVTAAVEVAGTSVAAGGVAGDDSAQQASAAAVLGSPLMHIESFLEALTNADKDGRIIINKQELLSKSSVKFLLLNPGVHFTDILSEARAVIIAGGTMQPIADFKDQLLFTTGTSPERILEFSCGHVIPADQLLPISLARGSSGLELDFTYQSRTNPDMISELGRVVYNTSNIVSGGIVVFFPSYEYERLVHVHWEQTGFLLKISAKKKVFREPKVASQVDALLQEYTNFIKKHPAKSGGQFDGALLSCVVGGKMSEGINFSDELGRCVIMVGLPYPNIYSAELKEKMDYLNAQMPRAADDRLPGQIHFENLCMKAVNQSIGRAIRHKDDYAAILLLDHRYLRASVTSKLPNWIRQHLRTEERFGPAFASLRKFFNSRYALEGRQTRTNRIDLTLAYVLLRKLRRIILI